jgi:hypothetical protein
MAAASKPSMRGSQSDEPALAVEDVEELIGVDMQKPAAGPHIGMGEHAA